MKEIDADKCTRALHDFAIKRGKVVKGRITNLDDIRPPNLVFVCGQQDDFTEKGCGNLIKHIPPDEGLYVVQCTTCGCRQLVIKACEPFFRKTKECE